MGSFLKNIFFLLIPFFSVFSINCGGGGGGGREQPTPQPSQYTGKAILGNLAGAIVKIFKVDNDGSLNLLWTETTSNGNTLSEIGNFNSHANELEDNTLYIYQVSGGNDWDADEDGLKDATPTQNKGSIRAIVLGKEVKAVGNNFVVSSLTEFQYRWLARYLKYNFDKNTLLQERDRVASKMLKEDLNGDSVIDQKDVISFVPQTDSEKLNPVIYSQGEKFVQAIHEDKPAVPRLAAVVKKLSVSTGGFRYIVRDGNYAYTVSPFRVINVSDPLNPSVVSTLNTVYGYRLFKSGDYIYIADRTSGLYIVDVSNPSNPQEKGSIDLGDNDFNDVYVSGNYAFVTTDLSENLIILDISDKNNPTFVSSLNIGDKLRCIALKGSYAYIGGRFGLYIVDVSDKNNPVLVKSIATGRINDIKIIDNYLYTSNFSIYDISNPDSPVRTGYYFSGITAFSIKVNGNYAFVGDYKGIEVIDISDKNNPKFVGSIVSSSVVYGIDIKDDYLLIANYTKNLKVASILSGIQSISKKDFDEPEIVKIVETHDYTEGLFIDGNDLYVANGNNGLKIFDISDPVNMTQIGNLYTSYANKVYVSGDYAYIADHTAGLQIIDVSDKTNPQVKSSLDTPGAAYGIFYKDGYVYLADYSSQNMYVIDVSNPSNPSITGTLPTSTYVYDVYVVGNYAYVADSRAGLLIADVSNPSNPSVVGSYDTDGSAYGITVDGNYAYVSDAYRGLKIVDISDKTNPTLVGSVDTPDWSMSTLVYGDYAFVCDGSSGVQIVDISDKANPRIVEYIKNKHLAKEAVIKGDYLFIADGSGGILVVDMRIFDQL